MEEPKAKGMSLDSLAGPIAGLVGQGLSMIMGGSQDRRQIRQQGKLQDLQIKGQKEMGDYNREKEYEMWKRTGLVGQVEQAKEAGMSVSHLYGGTGVSGATTGGAGGQVSGGTADGAGVGQMNAIQQGMAIAQMENLKANTEKQKAEAENISGVDKELKTAQIGDITQGINNKIQAERLTKLQADLAEATQGDNEERIMWEAKRAITEYEKAVNETFVAKQTQTEAINILKAEASYGLLRNDLAKAGINKTEAEIRKIANDIALGNANIEFQGTDKILGKYVEQVAQKILGLGGK